ncbi:hypothetical protein [Burkholderia sp. MSMB1589WGS]|uniref:hypothetical protein n=1 Tax=Burkholderia sp. MSMB1589WGS TaxID=1636425 RepID=UPI0018D4B64D|nr:hypothetical protein [Burkholderia sp. MSMB1589WGS]
MAEPDGVAWRAGPAGHRDREAGAGRHMRERLGQFDRVQHGGSERLAASGAASRVRFALARAARFAKPRDAKRLHARAGGRPCAIIRG